jgi:hypothetical protein
MKLTLASILLTMMLSLCFCDPVFACHDQGQGKSQDCNDLGDIATAPEPSTIWLFAIGVLGLATVSRLKSSRTGTVTLK